MDAVRPCVSNDENVIRVDPDSHITFDGCNAMPKTCIEWDAFDIAQVSYTITRENSSSRLKGKFDLCNDNHPSNMRMVVKALGFPYMCPVEEVSFILRIEFSQDLTNNFRRVTSA